MTVLYHKAGIDLIHFPKNNCINLHTIVFIIMYV